MDIIAVTCPGTAFTGIPLLFWQTGTGQFWQPKTSLDLVRFTGSAGLCRDGELLWIAAAMEEGSACLVEYDLPTGKAKIWPLSLCVDPHSIVVVDGDVLVVSTGNNMIIACAFDGDTMSETVAYRLDEANDDILHLNALHFHENCLLVGMFGRRLEGKRWVDAVNGCARSLDGSFVSDRMHHPHSILSHNDRLMGIESMKNRIVDLRTGKTLLQTDVALGYMRGLAAEGSHLAFATSHRREDRENANSFSISLVDVRSDGQFELLASASGPRGYEEAYDLLVLPSDALPDRRRLVRDCNADRPVLIGPKFDWSRMQSIALTNDEWGERFNLFRIPRNVVDLGVKLVVFSEFPIVHLKFVLSTDDRHPRLDHSIERWLNIGEGLSIYDLDWQRFARLRGDFEPACVRIALIGGILPGFDGTIRYQFVTSDGDHLHIV